MAEFSGLWDASALLRRFIYAPGASTPFLVVERATGAKTFLHADRLGSIVATADVNGAITGSAKYSPYGVTAGSIPTMFGYTGHQYDREIGIYYARARTYMPLLGRFMQVDPVGYKQSLNLYTYGLGNPVAHTDPSGAIFDFGEAFIAAAIELGKQAIISAITGQEFEPDWLSVGISFVSAGFGTSNPAFDKTSNAGRISFYSTVSATPYAGSGPVKLLQENAIGTHATIEDARYAAARLIQTHVAAQEAKLPQWIDKIEAGVILRKTANGYVGDLYAGHFKYMPELGGYHGAVTFQDPRTVDGFAGMIHNHPNWSAGKLSPADMQTAMNYARVTGVTDHYYVLHKNELFQFSRNWASAPSKEWAFAQGWDIPTATTNIIP